MEKIYQTLETVLHIFKHLEFRLKYPAARRSFNSLLSVLMFDILHEL